MRVFFDRELDTAATFWRVYRRDGVALGFTSHDRDLFCGGIMHKAAPGMVPSAIRLNADLSRDNAEVEGVLSHDSIRADELAAGLFDQAAIEIGIVDWELLDWHVLYSGRLGRIESDDRSFAAELKSAKQDLEQDIVPRTSPTCRAAFCGPGCGLSAIRFTSIRTLADLDFDRNRARFASLDAAACINGRVRFLEGPQTGLALGIVGGSGDWVTLDRPLAGGTPLGARAEIREGCDRTLATCASRFGNALNFRGEPFLPGNDLLARHGAGG
ncbi:DUF2163 domain-containing protein [Erythrobacter sp. HL-111]|uniref:DUF2163 domain-containing protein n=1 Tax=Erythrobacter sp. HL-111 TaxID=1798193 RepID=UPI0006DA34BC|nr:DUF2163 domain-containing protein [Erythrobacter sp. HL-111]KPP94114.1 MAG: hypothetical protein HLUCCO15_05180 [Erythrobacteraceae bacterium HL-111]SDS63218.1 phage conserved hypothetical protein BR0599 [Erythrobacter sp. HL-111]